VNDVRTTDGEEIAEEPAGSSANAADPATAAASRTGAEAEGDPDADGRPDVQPDTDLGAAPDADAPPDPAAEARAAAISRARRLLAAEPWAGASERITLWLVSPPSGLDAPVGTPVEAWLAIDRQAAQTLGDAARKELADGAIAQALPAGPADAGDEPPGSAAIFTVEALEALLAGEGRRALEARWSLRHAQPIADRLGRHESLVAQASQLPEGALERALRGAFLAVAGALPALGRLSESGDEARRDALPAAGEAAAGLARIACLLDEGGHPPLAWLLPGASETRLGRRIASWLDDLTRALARDEAATRRVVAARDAVIEQTHVLVAHRVGERPWMRDPAGFALRPPRR
jgi:hypothetical protein